MNSPNMKLIIGLGNPGKEYQNTRHNIGWLILDRLAEEWGFHFNKKKFQGSYAEHRDSEGNKIIFVKPQTFMNLSGECVQKWVNYLKIPGHDILVVHDELDIPLGNFKAQWAAGSAGHGGVQSILDQLGHKNICRLRVGVGHPGRKDRVVDHVLSTFSKEEQKALPEVLERGVEAIKTFIKLGLDPVSQMVNRSAGPGTNQAP